MRMRAGVLGAAVLGCVGMAEAQDDPRRRFDIPRDLAQQMYRESQERDVCRAKTCDVVRSKKMQGEDVSCRMVKTWPAIDLKEKLKNRFTWRWGDVQCVTNLALDRALVLRAAYLPRFVANVGKHDIECRIAAKDGEPRHTVKFTVDPVVTFEGAKAVKAALGWGQITGSGIMRLVLWSATAADNAFNIAEKAALEHINDFFGSKCDAVPTPTVQSRRAW